MTVTDAIAAADAILPGHAAPEGEIDARWQAIIAVSEFIESDPEPVWEFATRWGGAADGDLRMAIATCIVEHLFERYPEGYRERAAAITRADPLFADMLSHCWAFDGWATLQSVDEASSRRITVRRFESNDAADRNDGQYWQSIPVAERVLMVWRLSLEQWRLQGDPPYEPGLHRSLASFSRR